MSLRGSGHNIDGDNNGYSAGFKWTNNLMQIFPMHPLSMFIVLPDGHSQTVYEIIILFRPLRISLIESKNILPMFSGIPSSQDEKFHLLSSLVFI